MANPITTKKHKCKIMEPNKNISNPISPHVIEIKTHTHTKYILNINPHHHPNIHTNPKTKNIALSKQTISTSGKHESYIFSYVLLICMRITNNNKNTNKHSNKYMYQHLNPLTQTKDTQYFSNKQSKSKPIQE